MNTEPQSVIEQVFFLRGRAAEIARRLQISAQAVGKWRRSGRIPIERVIDVEQITGISRHDLRPDIYPREDRTTIPVRTVLHD